MRLFMIAVVCIALGFGAAYMISASSQDGSLKAAESDNQLYTCGMHPEIISKEPGICPICNMKLTPKRDVAAGDNAIRIDPATKQNMGLLTAPAAYRDLTRTIHTFGEVAVPEPKVHKVTLKTEGWIERLFVSEEGVRVSGGQPLLEIYSPDLVATQKELLVAIESGTSPSMLRLADAARQRLMNWDISDDQLSRLTETGEITRTMVIRSPAEGFVRMKNVVEGNRVSPHTVLYEIASVNTVWVEARIYEQDLPHVKVGQPARLSTPGLPGQTFEARVEFVSPWLDESGQAEIRLTLANPNLELKPSMYADVAVESALEGERLTIPRSAVINSGVRQLVFVTDNNDAYRPREITTGATGRDDMIEVVDGLMAGELVVISGQFLLDSETRLNEAVGLVESHSHQQHSEKKTSELPDDPYDIHTCPMPSHYHVLNYGPGQCPDCGMDLVPLAETDNSPVYVCSMPECKVAAHEPGTCPVCNMHLIEYNPEHAHDR